MYRRAGSDDCAPWRVRICQLVGTTTCALASCLHCGDHETTVPADDGGSPSLPNLVLIYVDDAGYADTAPTGAGFPTPNLDTLAREGTLYTSFHAAQPVCSASRAALLTGAYPNRIGITGALFPDDPIGLNPEEQTLAEVARSKGYRTAAFGKWHLGNAAPFFPTNQGFEEFAGIPYSNDMWPAESSDFPPLPFYEGTTITNPDIQPEDQAALTERLTTYAVDFIERHRAEPFFLYLAHPKPHVPLFVSERFAGASGKGLYADVMMEIDWSVGEILGALERTDLSETTWVVFASDNGPWLTYGNHAGNAKPYREGKFTTFEGGTRVPLLMRLPGYIPAGGVTGEPFMNIDLLPTFAALIDAAPPMRPIDGKNVWDTITRGVPALHDAYYFWNGDALEAVLMGKWKLHFPHDYQSVTVPGSDGERGTTTLQRIPLSLFDLKSDPGETNDLADQYPTLVQQMTELADAHRRALEAGQRAPGHL